MRNRQETLEAIGDYLQKGGLCNPELMEHDKVRDLLMDCRALLSGERQSFVHHAGCPALTGAPVCTCPKTRFS